MTLASSYFFRLKMKTTIEKSKFSKSKQYAENSQSGPCMLFPICKLHIQISAKRNRMSRKLPRTIKINLSFSILDKGHVLVELVSNVTRSNNSRFIIYKKHPIIHRKEIVGIYISRKQNEATVHAKSRQKKIESNRNSAKEVNSRIVEFKAFYLYRFSFQLAKKPSKILQLPLSQNHR